MKHAHHDIELAIHRAEHPTVPAPRPGNGVILPPALTRSLELHQDRLRDQRERARQIRAARVYARAALAARPGWGTWIGRSVDVEA